MSRNIKPTTDSVKPISICCEQCKLPRSRRHGLIVALRDRIAFVCQACCKALYCSGLGYDRETLAFFLTYSQKGRIA